MHPPIDFKYLVLQITAIAYYGVIITTLPPKKNLHTLSRGPFFPNLSSLTKFMDSNTEPVSSWSNVYNYKIIFLC